MKRATLSIWLVLVILSVCVLPGCKKKLHWAVCIADCETVERLIDEGADINSVNEEGQTLLHMAVICSRNDMVELLIRKGADIDINAKDSYSRWTPLHAACANSLYKSEIALTLIRNGADINARAKDEITPLHEAARGGNVDVVELLIARGAEINAKNKAGSTPLHWAILIGKAHKKEIADVLLNAGADPLIEDGAGETSIEIALMEDDSSLAELLVKAIDLNKLNYSGDTPLHYAVRRHNLKMIEILVAHGADVDKQDADGDTPLYIAEHYIKDANMVEILQQTKASGGK